MEWEIQVKWNDLGATSATSSDLSHSEGLMLDLGPREAAIMAIKSPSSDKESCKSNLALGHAHTPAVIRLPLSNLTSLWIFAAISQHPCLSRGRFLLK